MLQEIATPSGTRESGAIGWQCVLDLHNCATPHLDDIDWVRTTMLDAARQAQATIVTQQFHRFAPHGISGIVVIGESHLAIHVWPERAFAAIDVFTCNSQLNMRAAADWLVEAFGATEAHRLCLQRGHADLAAGTITHDKSRAFALAPFPSVGSSAGELRDDLYIDHDDGKGGHWFVANRTIAAQRTACQGVEIIEFAHFGRALMLDGKLQSAECDEYIYHEALVQPALCLHPAPRRVLIIGGGEGATAREVLKHPVVEEVVMVDFDRELVALAREYLPSWHLASFADSRLRFFVRDGYEFVTTARTNYDVIIIDVVDSFEGGPAEALYTREFYRVLKRRLAPGGILVVQAMECDASESNDHLRVRENLKGLFAHTRSYLTFVPSFWSTWGFVLASDAIDPLRVSPDAIDSVINDRGVFSRLRFYDGRTHKGMFAISKDLRAVFGEL